MNRRIFTRHWLMLMKVISSYLTLMEILFRLKDVEMMRIKTKNTLLDQTSKRRRAGKEPESTSVPKEKTSKTTGKSTEGSKSHHKSAGESAQVEEPIHTTKYLEEPVNQEFKTGVIEDQPNKETPQLPDWESARHVYFIHRIIAVIKLQIVKWHGYKHLDWITVRRDDDKLYTFKEGDFKRLHLQDNEDMLIFLVQGKLKNLNVEERLAFSVSL
ncbi:hypothetical protein Tco_1396889 [Tanacetum coccineum]